MLRNLVWGTVMSIWGTVMSKRDFEAGNLIHHLRARMAQGSSEDRSPALSSSSDDAVVPYRSKPPQEAVSGNGSADTCSITRGWCLPDGILW